VMTQGRIEHLGPAAEVAEIVSEAYFGAAV
jgi:hypothetical protein